MDKQIPDNFQDSETPLYDAIMGDTGYYTFVKTYRMYNTKSEW